MSVRTTATFNAPLTSYAQGIAQDRLSGYRLAQLLCPIVPVATSKGTYKKFDDRNSFLVADTARAIGGARQRLQFEATDGTFNCQPHGLEIGRDDFEEDLVGGPQRGTEVGNALLDQGKIKSLVSRKVTSYVNRVVGKVTSSLTAVVGRGVWSNPDIDPIDQIDEQLNAVATVAGTIDNISVIMGLQDWMALRRNPKVKARLGLQPAISITKEILVGGLLFPVNLEVSAFSLISSKFGQSGGALAAKTQIVGGYCIILYGQPNPTPMDPSAFKCFSTSAALVDSVKTYRDESAASDVHAVDWSEDIEATGTACAKLLAIT